MKEQLNKDSEKKIQGETQFVEVANLLYLYAKIFRALQIYVELN